MILPHIPRKKKPKPKDRCEFTVKSISAQYCTAFGAASIKRRQTLRDSLPSPLNERGTDKCASKVSQNSIDR